MTEIDTNVSSYSLSELLTIVDLDNENVTKEQVIKNTDYLINKFKIKNPELAVFFQEVQSELLQYIDGLEVHHNQDNTGKIIVEGDFNVSINQLEKVPFSILKITIGGDLDLSKNNFKNLVLPKLCNVKGYLIDGSMD
jgi:hypothetical protein